MMHHLPISRFAAIAAVLSACGAARAVDIVVPTQMPLASALVIANSGDTITLLPAGSPYSLAAGFSYSNKRLTIRGSTGNPADVVLDGGGVATVLAISGASASGSIIRDLTVRNGMGPSGSNATGAGILATSGADLDIRNCIIRDNVVPAPEGNGAGVAALSSSVIMSGTVLQNNTIAGDGTGDGAGLYVNHGTVQVTGCTFTNNAAGAAAAALGGGVWVADGDSTFTACTFTANSGANGGAVYVADNAQATFEACRFVQNVAAFNGGALYFEGVGGALRSCLIRSNACGDNGAAIVADGLAVDSCTIANNSIGPNSIYRASAASPMRFTNTIIAGNSSVVGSHLYRYCVLQGTSWSFASGSVGFITTNPLFVNAAAGDFHLQPNSPAIDRGNSMLYVGLPVDLDGNPRGVDIPAMPNNGVSLFGPVVDIGAFEAQPPAACYANCDNSTTAPVLNVLDFSCFLNRFAAGCP